MATGRRGFGWRGSIAACRRQIPNVEGEAAEIRTRRRHPVPPLGRSRDFVYRVRPDGTGMRKAIEQAIPLLGDVSPDGRFIVGWTTLPGSESSTAQLFPLNGGAPLPVAGYSVGADRPAEGWSRFPLVRSPTVELCRSTAARRNAATDAGSGTWSEEDVAKLPGARRVDAMIVPGPSPDVYVFQRTTTQRNLHSLR